MRNNSVTFTFQDHLVDMVKGRHEELLRGAAQVRLVRQVARLNEQKRLEMRWEYSTDEQDRHLLRARWAAL